MKADSALEVREAIFKFAQIQTDFHKRAGMNFVYYMKLGIHNNLRIILMISSWLMERV